MLHLAEPTEPRWFERVKDHMPVIMLDHTHLEKRAASTALSMIFRYNTLPELAVSLGEVVQEEMEHFVRMVNVLKQRDIALRRLEPAPYASKLAKHARKKDPEAMLDKLLVAALIEARSCERFKILSERLDDPELAALYGQLYQEEARHHTLYTSLARAHFPHDQVTARLDELATLEAEALRVCTEEPRLHSY